LIVHIRSVPKFLPRINLHFRDKLALWFGGIVLLSTGVAITLSYVLSVDHLIDQFGRSLIAVANGPTLTIDPDAFKSLHSPEQMNSAAYIEIRDKLRLAKKRAIEANIHLHYLYTMTPTDKPDTWQFVVDEQPQKLPNGKDNPEFSALGDPEKLKPDDVILKCYKTGEPAADKTLMPYPDHPEWGELLSVAVPIRDRTGKKIIGIVGADARPNPLEHLQNQTKVTALLCLGISLVVVVIGSAIVAVQVTKPIGALVEGTQAVAKGDLNYEVHIKSLDEMGQLGEAFNEMVAGLRQRDLYKYQFGRYVSRQIADTILANPERDFWQGERKRATIFFSDIRGFTAMSEKLPPEEVVSRLNEYLSVMVDIVFKFDGTLDKFIGDSIMAVFGAPVSTGNEEERAVRAAIAMQEAARQLAEQWSRVGRTGFKIGIGINTGDVIVGNIGSEQRIEYAAIGDHVNLAARLEGLNKEYGTSILITDETYRPVEHLIEARWVDKVAVRGREAAVDIYEVLGLKAADVGPPSSTAATP